jgi:IS5 family transposase
MHLATDTNGIIQEVIATNSATHDSTQFEKLTRGEDRAIFADSGYM